MVNTHMPADDVVGMSSLNSKYTQGVAHRNGLMCCSCVQNKNQTCCWDPTVFRLDSDYIQPPNIASGEEAVIQFAKFRTLFVGNCACII